jgi:hypothetical protein
VGVVSDISSLIPKTARGGDIGHRKTQQALKRVMDNLPTIADSIEDTMKTILKIDIPADTTQFEKQIDVLGKTMKLVGTVATIFATMTKHFPTGISFKLIEELAAKWFGTEGGKKSVLSLMIGGMASALPGIFNAVKDILNGSDLKSITQGSIDKLKSILEIVSTLGKVISDFLGATIGGMQRKSGKNAYADATWFFRSGAPVAEGGDGTGKPSLLELLVGSIAGVLPTLFGALFKALSDPRLTAITKETIAKLKSVLDIVAVLAGVVKDMFGIMPKGTGAAEGGIDQFTTDIEAIFGKKKGEGSLGVIIDGISNNMPTIVDALIKATGKMSGKKLDKAKIKMLGDILGIVATFAGVIKDMMSIMPETKGLSGKQVMEKARWMFEKDTSAKGSAANNSVLSVIAKGIGDNLPIIVGAITDMFAKGGDMDKVKGFSGKIKLLSSIFKAVGEFASVVSTLSAMNVKGDGPTLQKKLEDIAALFAPFVPEVTLGGFTWKGTGSKGGGFTQIVAAISAFATAIKPADVKKLYKGGRNLKAVAYAISAARSAVMAGFHGSTGGKDASMGTQVVNEDSIDTLAIAMDAITKEADVPGGKSLIHYINKIGGPDGKIDAGAVKNINALGKAVRAVHMLVYQRSAGKGLLNNVKVKALSDNVRILGGMAEGTLNGVATEGMPSFSAGPAVQAYGNIERFVTATKSLDAEVTRIAKGKGIGDLANVTKVSAAIGTFGAMLNGEEGTPGFKVIQALSGGELKISHNIGSAKVSVTVNLGSKTVARQLAKCVFDGKQLKTEATTRASNC